MHFSFMCVCVCVGSGGGGDFFSRAGGERGRAGVGGMEREGERRWCVRGCIGVRGRVWGV